MTPKVPVSLDGVVIGDLRCLDPLHGVAVKVDPSSLGPWVDIKSVSLAYTVDGRGQLLSVDLKSVERREPN